jgi:hypothetical protein
MVINAYRLLVIIPQRKNIFRSSEEDDSKKQHWRSWISKHGSDLTGLGYVVIFTIINLGALER